MKISVSFLFNQFTFLNRGTAANINIYKLAIFFLKLSIYFFLKIKCIANTLIKFKHVDPMCLSLGLFLQMYNYLIMYWLRKNNDT